MAIRRRFLRFALILFVVGLGATVLLGLRERAAPAAGLVVQRSDPNAVIQTRTSRIVQTDAAGDNFNLVAGRQLTYPDGDVRLLDCETAEALDIAITPAVLARYREAYQAFAEQLTTLATERGAGLLRVDADGDVLEQLAPLFAGGALAV